MCRICCNAVADTARSISYSVMASTPDTLTAVVSPEQAGRRFDQVLAELYPDYSRSRLQAWVKEGRALLDGKTVQPRARLQAGQEIRLTPPGVEPQGDAAEPIRLDVVHEDEDLIVINKPAGLVVHPGAGNPAGTLMNGLLHYAPELEALPRAGILHRIDKDTSGLLLVARSMAAHTRLVRDLEQRLAASSIDPDRIDTLIDRLTERLIGHFGADVVEVHLGKNDPPGT